MGTASRSVLDKLHQSDGHLEKLRCTLNTLYLHLLHEHVWHFYEKWKFVCCVRILKMSLVAV